MLSLNKFGSGWPVLVYRHKGSIPAVFSLALGRPRANSEAWNLFLHSVAVLLELKGIPHQDAVALLMISDQDHYVCFYLLSFLLASVGLASSSCFSPWKKETKHKNRWFSHIDPSLVTFSHAKKSCTAGWLDAPELLLVCYPWNCAQEYSSCAIHPQKKIY